MKSLKTLYAAVCTLFLCMYAGAQENAPIVGKDGPPDMFLKAPKDTDLSMRLLSLDGKPYVYFLKNGDTYAPVTFSGSRDVRTVYSLPKTERVDFYKREVVDNIIYFTKVFSIDAKGSTDIIGGLYVQKNGGFKTFSADISLERIPVGNFCVINMSPFSLGFSVDKRNNKKLGVFESITVSSPAKGPVATTQLDVYDLGNAKKPRLVTSRSYNYRSNRRYIELFFEVPKPMKYSDDPEAPPPPPPTDSISMYDIGPRR